VDRRPDCRAQHAGGAPTAIPPKNCPTPEMISEIPFAYTARGDLLAEPHHNMVAAGQLVPCVIGVRWRVGKQCLIADRYICLVCLRTPTALP